MRHGKPAFDGILIVACEYRMQELIRMPEESRDIGQIILSAMETGAIDVHYQPQLTADGVTLTGVEALVRWRDPNGGFVSPATFIPDIEEQPELIGQLGKYVLRRACEDAREWPGLLVAVNVAPIQFLAPGFVQDVSAILDESNLEPRRLELEILETSWFSDPQKAVAVIHQLRSQKISIAMDDFGTGYASLAALMQLPLDKLKIDSSFVVNSHEIRSASIVHSIVALARSIGLKVTAEGVETHEQQRFLRTAGCHYLQGHYFSEAVPAPLITKMLERPGSEIRRR
jgi:EAL domain-containing protein (putative c-di-GMP-specific phosphodiesterase class I)